MLCASEHRDAVVELGSAGDPTPNPLDRQSRRLARGSERERAAEQQGQRRRDLDQLRC